MSPLNLLREALATTWANKVPTALVALLVAVMCGATLTTVGQTAAAEQQLADRLDGAGSRLLTVTDAASDDLVSEAVVTQSHGLSSVERAIGTQVPVDVTNAAVGRGGPRAAAWTVVGDLDRVVELTSGRWPGPGEALISATAQHGLAMDAPAGAIEVHTGDLGEQHSVVGSFIPREPFTDYEAGLVIASEPGASADVLHVILTDSDLARASQAAVLELIAPPNVDSVIVNSPISLADLQAEVSADFGSFGRALLLGVLGAGALLIAIVVLADVLVRRKDLGRRRALGATRFTISALVVGRTLLPALLGAAVGTGVGLWLVDRWAASVPPVSFTAGVAVLAILASVVSAVVPAVFASYQDPVRVLRTA